MLAVTSHIALLSLIDDAGPSHASPTAAKESLDWQPSAKPGSMRFGGGRTCLHRLYGGMVHYLQGE